MDTPAWENLNGGWLKLNPYAAGRVSNTFASWGVNLLNE
jgi:hypothetical protein